VAIVATGLRDRIRDYTCRLMRVLGRPRVVLPTHFDDFRAPAETPLDADARKISTRSSARSMPAPQKRG
jgi:hypothetical protein